MKFEGRNYRVELLNTESGIAIVGGHFGEVRIAYGELFKLRMKHVETGEVRILTSLDGWQSVSVSERDGAKSDISSNNVTVTFVYCHPGEDETEVFTALLRK